MNQLTIKQQKSADGSWIDEAANAIPYDRVKKSERLNEKLLAGLAKRAIALNADLKGFKSLLIQKVDEMYDAFVAENGGKAPGKGKGGITLWNFDRTIKVELKINEQIEFDENFITLAKDKLDELLKDGLEGAADFVKPLVMDAFKTSGGRLDTKRVLGLRRYADRVTDSRYAEAMGLIDKAIRKPKSKEYMQVWVKDEKGEYQDVQLNFSAI